MQYPALFTSDDGAFVVTFRDIPEAITQGDTEDEALELAEDVLRESMAYYLEEKRQVPMPSAPREGERLISVAPSVAAKVLLLNEMLAQRVTSAELARRLDVSRQDVVRLTDLSHATKIDRIDQALAAMGKKLEISVV
jgi:antitoxin HicB